MVSPKLELLWIDSDLRFTRFIEIIWLQTQADRNTVHYFQVWHFLSGTLAPLDTTEPFNRPQQIRDIHQPVPKTLPLKRLLTTLIILFKDFTRFPNKKIFAENVSFFSRWDKDSIFIVS